MNTVAYKTQLTSIQISKWVKALRSDNYLQGDTGLCDVRCGVAEYSALGVLLEEVYGEDIWMVETEVSSTWFELDHTLIQSDDAWLPKTLLSVGLQDVVQIQSDYLDYTFSKTATWIETHLLPKD